MSQQSTITSVGIDIGTTTTQLVFSRLLMRNTAGPTQTPRFAITHRDITYTSPVAFTPKTRLPGQDEDVIDEDRLGTMIRDWYAEAGMTRDAVTSGAVIITGESLKKSNARQTVFGLSSMLGNFVVATAGPHLESVIAGRGSGAAAYSAKEHACTLNIDIGGGTSNFAVFRNGQVVDSSCLNIGGRLVETDRSGTVTKLHSPIIPVLEDLFGTVPSRLDATHLHRLVERMASLIADQVRGIADATSRKLMQTPSLHTGYVFDAVFISGGVGACCQTAPENDFAFGDIGPLLAGALLRDVGMRALPLKMPDGAIQATVIGAGAWSLSLSGSTVWVDDTSLPRQNIPVVSVPINWENPPENLGAFIAQRVRLFDVDVQTSLFALAFTELPVRYTTLRILAEGLGAYAATLPVLGFPFVVVLQQDMGKALGMELKRLLNDRPLVVVDEILLGEGDYLDLGKPMYAGGVVPLVIKSLAFSHHEYGDA